MHTTVIHHSEHPASMDHLEQDFVVHHNGDFSGDCYFDIPQEYRDFYGRSRLEYASSQKVYTVKIPFDVLLELVGRYIQQGRMSILEDETGRATVARLVTRL